MASGEPACSSDACRRALKGTGTHKGEYSGLAPTGKKITWEAFDIWRIADGKVVELWYAIAEMDFYKQLGLIEYTEKGKKLFA